MAIANTISDFLIDRDIDYHVYPHSYTESASESARETHIDPARLAKAVVMATKGNKRRKYTIAVLPASCEVNTEEFGLAAHEHIELAKEYELSVLFPDCAVGAVPVFGEAYGLQTVVDESFEARSDDVFFEAGDHEELIRVSADQFVRLMAGARFAAFSHEMSRNKKSY